MVKKSFLMFLNALAICCFVILWGCGQADEKLAVSETGDEISIGSGKGIQPSTDTVDNLNLRNADIRIVELKKDELTYRSDEYLEECRKWEITKDRLLKILQLVEPIDSKILDYTFFTLPCQFSGQLTVNGERFTYSVNGGSHLQLRNSNRDYTFACGSDECETFFIEGEDKSMLNEE